MSKKLYLKKSNLNGAGIGLFTRKPISKGEKIVEYRGRIQTWKEVKNQDGENPYLFYINSKTVINPLRAKKMMARYANDAMGLTRFKGLRNNSEYDVKGKRCFIVATRNIKAGEEILVGYGREYWKIIKEIKEEK